MADKKFYVVHTKKGYWVGAFIFDEQLRHAKIYTSLHFANETVKRLNYANADKYDPKIREVIICLADEKPAADVVEVRHGEWIEHDDDWCGVYYTCSACGCDWTTIDGTPQENNMKYCPECGAKMDGERKEQT